MMKVLEISILCLVAVITLVCAASYEDDNSGFDSPISIVSKPSFNPAYRLPNNSVPLRYDLWLKTGSPIANYDFEGRVKIHVKTVKATNNITLHMRNLLIDNIDLLAADGSLKQSKLQSEYIDDSYFLQIFLPDLSKQNDELVLDIKYHGKMSFEGKGFCNPSRSRRYTVYSRLEPFYARRVFPCFDEPQLLSIINLRIQHNKRFDAIATAPIVKREEVAGTDYVTSSFEDTPLMPTYRLSFAVTDLPFISNNDTKIEQRIYAERESIVKGEVNTALSITEPFVKKLEEHFGKEFPFKKVDHVFADNYDEGIGLGTTVYNESSLYGASTYASYYIAYQLTQHFFGGLVTQWWTDSWLSKGISQFFACYLLDQMHPNEGYAEKLRLYFPYMTDPPTSVNNWRKTPLNHVEYLQTVIAMVMDTFNEALTPATFAKGIKYYLTAMQYKAATPADLHRALQQAYDEDFPGNGIDIDEAMRTWEDQTEFPVITVEKSGGKFILSQRNDSIFTIPVTYATNSHPKFGRDSRMIWMKTKVIEIESASGDDWIILNPSMNSLYKVKYSEEIILSILDTFATNIDLIPPRNRARFFDEFSSKFNEGLLPVSAGFKLFEYLKHETGFIHWGNFWRLEEYFYKRLLGTKVYDKYEQYVQSVVRPQLLKLGFENDDGEPRATSYARRELLEVSCKYNLPECLQNSLKLMKAAIESRDSLGYVCDGMKIADEATYMKVLRVVESEESFGAVAGLVRLLTCSTDQNRLKTFLDKMMAKSTSNFFFDSIDTIMSKNPRGAEVVLDMVTENFEALRRR
jgi:hypothetical protein